LLSAAKYIVSKTIETKSEKLKYFMGLRVAATHNYLTAFENETLKQTNATSKQGYYC